jgi:pimeloyl-ACP methyl ester carboxylesterase
VVHGEPQSQPKPVFREGWVEADGFWIRYMEAGEGPPLVHLHGAGGLRLTPAHDLLGRLFRVVAFEMPGFGMSPENVQTQNMQDMAATIIKAAAGIGLDRFALMGTSFGGKVALWMAAQEPAAVTALVLEAPAAIRPENTEPVSGTAEQIAQRLFAHPDRMPAEPVVDPIQAEQALALVRRLRGPARDAELEERLRDVTVPTLILFGTLDSIIPPEMGRLYKELMPHSHLMFVYDAGHLIAAERPEAFAEAVTDFLQRDDAFLISRTRTVIFP